MESFTHAYTHHHQARDQGSSRNADVGWHFPDHCTETLPDFESQIPCIQYADPQCAKLRDHLLSMDADAAEIITATSASRRYRVGKKPQ